MIIKEFDLDLPYFPNQEKIKSIMREKGLTDIDASWLDYEENWKDKRRNFRLDTRCMTAMFERLFEKMKTKDCWKILVECVQTITYQISEFANINQVDTSPEKFGF